MANFPHLNCFFIPKSNVVINWNILRACGELGINRVAQASSVNVLTLVYSKQSRIRYFPIDEDHPCEPDEPYGLSKMCVKSPTLVRHHPYHFIQRL